MRGAKSTRRLPWWAFSAIGALTTVCFGATGAALSRGTARSRGLQLSYPGLIIAVAVLAALSLVTLWFRVGRRRTALLGLWAGTYVGVLGTAVATSTGQFGGVLAEIGVVAFALLTALPLLVGALCQALLEEGIGLVRRRGSLRAGEAPAHATDE